MQVVLLERVEALGRIGDVVNVKAGYARNFLLPQGKALRATEDNIKRFEALRADLERRNQELKTTAEGLSGKVDGQTFVILRQAGESGQLYGSVSSRDVVQAVSSLGVTITRGDVELPKAIKTLGLHPVLVRLHAEVKVPVTLNVARSAEEAERQARGEIIALTPDDEAEDAVDVDNLFETEEAARRVQGEPEGEAGAEAAARP